jgi:hypothetical protein
MFDQFLFDGTGLGIDPVEDGNIAIRPARASLVFRKRSMDMP